MTGAIVRRIGWTLVVVWFVVTTTFVMTALGGRRGTADPAKTLLGPEGMASVRAHNWLDLRRGERVAR